MDKLKIYYGTLENKIDVTELCFKYFLHNNIIQIPHLDLTRYTFLTDPVPNVVKSIFIYDGETLTHYEDNFTVIIDLTTSSISTFDNNLIDSKIHDIHLKLKINYGSFYEELPEQKMVVKYLKGNETVLEIGGNVGRNSLIISSILENSGNLLVLECDELTASQLKENRDLNNFSFIIESSALSKKKVILNGWDSKPSDELEEGWKWVNTITYDELKSKYNMNFDTLVLDCEGAFYYILQDMPEILNGINLIIMENDYHDITKKQYIDNVLTEQGFFVDYIQSGGWGPCFNNFFEVWKKN